MTHFTSYLGMFRQIMYSKVADYNILVVQSVTCNSGSAVVNNNAKLEDIIKVECFRKVENTVIFYSIQPIDENLPFNLHIRRV